MDSLVRCLEIPFKRKLLLTSLALEEELTLNFRNGRKISGKIFQDKKKFYFTWHHSNESVGSIELKDCYLAETLFRKGYFLEEEVEPTIYSKKLCKGVTTHFLRYEKRRELIETN